MLFIWLKIHTFLKKADVNEHYPAEIVQFEAWVKELYKCGKDIFLTKNGSNDIGDGETFYMHVLRFYMPQLARVTYERFKCGVGIWLMQPFERRNDEGKTIHCSFCNQKHNWIKQVMNRFYDNFVWTRYRKEGMTKYRKGKSLKRKRLEEGSDNEEEEQQEHTTDAVVMEEM